MVEISKAGPLDYIRFVISALILTFSLVVTSYAIIMQNTMFWKAVPGYAALIIFIVDLIILGIVEGLQIALVELKRQHPDSYKKSHPRAYRLGQVAAKGDNVERFLMGRQVFVVFLVFFCAKLTTIHLEEGEEFLFPAPHWFQAVFLETGIMACIVVVVIAQLMPQIVAAKYPVHFLQFFIMRPAYYCCIFVELTGLTHVTWLLSALFSLVTRMKVDDFTLADFTGGKDSEDMLDEDDEEIYEGAPLLAPSIANKPVRPQKPRIGTPKMQRKGKVDGALDNVKIAIEEEESSVASSESSTSNSTESLTKALTPKHKHKAKLHGYDMPKDQVSRFTELVDTINHRVSPDTLTVIRHHLDQHPEKFSQFPSVIGGKMYPAPQAIAQKIEEDGHEIPRFLTDISDEQHVPPHIVACELLAQNRQLREEVALLQAKLNASQE